MHCPKCGQQQIPGEVRFCSRCGFPMVAVSELLANGGMKALQMLPPVTEASPRRRGVKQGAMMFMVGAVVTIIFAILNAYLFLPEFFQALSAVIAFIGGPLRILFAAIFEEGARQISYVSQAQYQPLQQPPNFPVQQLPAQNYVAPALNPVQSVPSNPWRRTDTNELTLPQSVTEHTTRLLEKGSALEPDTEDNIGRQ